MKDILDIVHVIGASSRSGSALCLSLTAKNIKVVPVVRNAARFTSLPVKPLIADLTHAQSLKWALSKATHIVSCAHAKYSEIIINAAPVDAKLVFLGSTRIYSKWPDNHGNAVLAGERAFLASNRRGVMLHPTMIYGATDENNVRRLASLLRRLPIVPLPAAGRALVQPIYQGDVTRAILASLAHNWDGAKSLVIAGPDAVSYADFVRSVARAASLTSPRIVPVPAWLLQSIVPFLKFIPRMPSIGSDEIKRLLEDKNFNIAPMQQILQFKPTALADGLRMTFN